MIVSAALLGLAFLGTALGVVGRLQRPIAAVLPVTSLPAAAEPTFPMPTEVVHSMHHEPSANEPAEIVFDAIRHAGLDVVAGSTFADDPSDAGHPGLLKETLRRSQLAIASVPETGSTLTELAPLSRELSAGEPKWHAWRQISRQLDASAEALEGLGSFEQADVLRTAAATLRHDARDAQRR
jgi:hypothetical protein